MKPAMTEKQARAKNLYLIRHYHITLEQYNALLAYQNECCAICKRHRSEFKNNFAVDHSHTHPAIVRGLLCWTCNKGIQVFSDIAQSLTNGGIYLTTPPTSVLWGSSPVTAPGRVGSKARAKLLAKMNGTVVKLKKRKKANDSRRSVGSTGKRGNRRRRA